MPVYCYVCPACGHREDNIRRIDNRNDTTPCPHCSPDWDYEGNNGPPPELRRDLTAEAVHADSGYQTPILSEALGINPSQINEAKQRFPHHNFAPDGRMILSSHSERKKVLKELGFRDWDGVSG